MVGSQVKAFDAGSLAGYCVVIIAVENLMIQVIHVVKQLVGAFQWCVMDRSVESGVCIFGEINWTRVCVEVLSTAKLSEISKIAKVKTIGTEIKPWNIMTVELIEAPEAGREYHIVTNV